MPNSPPHLPLDHWNISVTVHRTGYAGLLPFVFLALLLWLVKPSLHPFVAIALAAYGAVVVSFLGGIHWGIALSAGQAARPVYVVWGIVPSLLAWFTVIMPAYAGLPLLGLILMACYLVDRKLWAAAGMSRWLTLRFRLTAVATLSCLLGAAAT
jgi:hypothetical protein